MKFNTIRDVNLKGKRVIIREDFNVPLNEHGVITNDSRIRAAIPTIEAALQQQAAIILLSHLGRPTEGMPEERLSLQPVQQRLQELLSLPIRLIVDGLQEDFTVKPGEVVLLENIRFQVGEKNNDPVLAKKLAALADVFVMDAFAVAHRAQASTHGIVKYIDYACAGPLLQQEITALEKSLHKPTRPTMAIVGGAKVSSKLSLIDNLIEEMDYLLLGGGIANTFLAAQGLRLGQSLFEPERLDEARHYLAKAKQIGCQILLPTDVVVAEEISQTAKVRVTAVDEIKAEEMILDIGPQSAKANAEKINQVKTLLWNGPVGVFEYSPFQAGTQALAEAIADSNAFSVAGGGDTIAAIDKFKIRERISYISTGGGAFLEFVEGKALPAIAILIEERKEISTIEDY